MESRALEFPDMNISEREASHMGELKASTLFWSGILSMDSFPEERINRGFIGHGRGAALRLVHSEKCPCSPFSIYGNCSALLISSP